MLKRLYNTLIRERLPRKIGVFNGVPVRQPRLLDRTDVQPDYEDALITAIRQCISEGDTVVVVGGGWGVGTVVAAENAGESGWVITFEASKEQTEHVRETIRINQVESRTDVEHAVVGPDIHVYGEVMGARQLSPGDLPECDVLVLDCEGAEMDILQHTQQVGKEIIVETHPMYDAPAEKVEELLTEGGFVVKSVRHEQSTYGELPVLTAVREESANS
ncbi:uncharacterized protein BN903_25 [Halorubrum sp. AJ67]|nr:uncharacterized protein BN903_25 [Halorubrum sp. AJ67]